MNIFIVISQSKAWNRFRSIKRSYYSLIFFIVICSSTVVLELFINNRALLVKYQGSYYFPTYGAVIPGTTFGFDYEYEANYRDLAQRLRTSQSDDFVWLAIVPFSPHEIDIPDGIYPPTAPSFAHQHYFGTDEVGRDVLARLAYGFRTAIVFALGLMFFEYAIGIVVGSAMGFFGGWFDLLMQRLIEVWSNIPFLYVVIILASIIEPTLITLMAIMVFFSWTNMTWYMRTEAYREKSRDYVLAAKSIGAPWWRILGLHILPNSLSVVISFMPFSLASGLVALVSLDFLGFGLPPSTPSIGELLSQGMEHLNDYWIVCSVLFLLVSILTMVTFIGEGVREAFDPKKYTYYE